MHVLHQIRMGRWKPYDQLVQMKQDRIILIFQCQVVKTIVSQYCEHLSAAGVTRYIRFREPKPLEAWECRQARTHGKIVLSGHIIQGMIEAVSHAEG
jgi:hypothetical protein